MMTLNDRQPIIVADAGPIMRLAAAGLLDALRQTNRRIVLVDRVEDELVGDLSKPFAKEIKTWIERMENSIDRFRTIYGAGVEALRAKQRTAEEETMLKASLRDSGELALVEFMNRWHPTKSSDAVVLYEDRRVERLFLEADYHLTLMTTRAFVRLLQKWGINEDAVKALESISSQYHLKPAMTGEIDPSTPVDLRQLPQETEQ